MRLGGLASQIQRNDRVRLAAQVAAGPDRVDVGLLEVGDADAQIADHVDLAGVGFLEVGDAAAKVIGACDRFRYRILTRLVTAPRWISKLSGSNISCR